MSSIKMPLSRGIPSSGAPTAMLWLRGLRCWGGDGPEPYNLNPPTALSPLLSC